MSISVHKKHEVAVIHGRFQPFHIGHLDYLLQAKQYAKRIVVGITNPSPDQMAHHSTDPNRTRSENNPLTYYERTLLIKAALREVGIVERAFDVVPFPINVPELISCYVPQNAVHYMTIFDDWGRNKAATLRQYGFNVEVLYECNRAEKNISATEIRQLICEEGEWEKWVASSVAQTMKDHQLDLKIRLASQMARFDLVKASCSKFA